MAPRSDYSWLLSYWRACVGRMPKGYEPRFRDVCSRFHVERVQRAISTVGQSELRRTQTRWALFLALFGEAP